MFMLSDQKYRKWKRGAIASAVLAASLFAAGCQNAAVSNIDEASLTPTPLAVTPAPEVISFEISEKAEEMTPPPAPTFTPTPAPTEVPFSHYAPTINMSFEELVGGTSDFGEMGSKNVNWPTAYPPADTYKIIVDVQWQVVMVYTKDESGAYTVPVRYMLCSTGDPGIKDGGETRRGTYNMLVPRVRYGHFLSGEAAQYWSLIRSRTYFHSILYDKQNQMSTYQVETYNALGSKNSHGCIRLTVPDARWIWYNIAYGTVCEIRDGDKKDTATEAIRKQLVLPVAPAKQQTIKAGSTPYTDNWTIESLLLAFDANKLVPFKNEKQPAPALKADDDEDTTTPPTTNTDGGGSTVTPDPGTTDGGGSTVTPDPGPTEAPVVTAAPAEGGSGDVQFATGTS